MFISIQKSKKKIALAELAASKIARQPKKLHGVTYHGKHLVIIGPPGSQKLSTVNSLIHLSSEVYEKARSVTDREPRIGEKEDSEYVFAEKTFSREKTFKNFLIRVLNVIEYAFKLLAGVRVQKLRLIKETVYTIGSTSYGISLDELISVIFKGKKFVAVTSVQGAYALRKIFGNDLKVIYLDVPREERAQALNHKYHHTSKCRRSLKEGLWFGDREVLEAKKFTSFITKIEPGNNPLNTAEEILFASEKKVLSN